ncbi:MAG: hypothetical protein PPFGHCPK_00151 [Spiroplasma endosymbiont of Drosophila atripex]|nr:MAG: hypothetical protein PPFGHCPK_00151 [Spiroplasma endosymbiont of Drosophila atripex]
MNIKDFSEVMNKLNEKTNEQNKKINLFQKKFEEEIKNIGSILEGIEMTSFGRLTSNDDNTNISNDKEIFNFFIYSIHSNFLSSGYKTLKSINLLLVDLPCGDIMALLRRYTETLYFFIFFVFLYEKYNKFEKTKKEKIKKWMNLKDKELLNFRSVNAFIIENKIIEEILNLLKINSKFLTTKRERLNDFIHYNGFLYLNYDKLDFEKKYEFIEEILNEIKLYTKIFILFCTTNCEYFCTSSDYVDCLELGIEPVEGTQYIMMPILDKYVMENFNEEEINYVRNHSSLKFGNEADWFMDSIQC